jgi:hypothetical protein
MVLSDENIVKFQALYKEHFGKEIGKEDAYEQGMKLLRLTSLSYRPMTLTELEAVKARQAELLQKQK